MTTTRKEEIVSICRFCLIECGGGFQLYPTNCIRKDDDLDSLPARIIAVTAIKVHSSDGLPQTMCRDCRYSLEKAYIFRKYSQIADIKLRKQILMMGNDKINLPLTLKNLMLNDECCEEFKYSLNFIKIEEEKRKAKQKRELLLELEGLNENVYTNIKQFTETARQQYDQQSQEMGEEIQLEIEPRAGVEKERIDVSKDLLDTIRKNEITVLLTELQNFLKIKLSKIEKNNEILDFVETPSVISDTNTIIDSDDPVLTLKASSSRITDFHTEINSQVLRNTDTECHDILTDDALFGIYDIKDQEDITNVSDGDSDATSCEMENKWMYPPTNKSKHNQNERYKLQDPTDSDTKNVMVFNIEQSRRDNMDMVELVNMKPDVIILQNAETIPPKRDVETLNSENKEAKMSNKLTKSQNPVSDVMINESGYCDDSHKLSTTVAQKELPCYLTTDTPKTYKCTICPKAFSMQHSLDRHLESHRKSQKKGIFYQCSECHIYLSCRGALSRHMLIHTGQRPHTCDHCGKAFLQREVLKRHLNSHTGMRPFQCPHCVRTYSQKVNLTQHINKYHCNDSNVFQHRCHLCPKHFHHASGLSRHLAYHSGVAFQCSGCERTFSDRSSINRHILTIHGANKTEKVVKAISKLETN